MSAPEPRHVSALEDARDAVDEMILLHRSAAIPALLAACVGWSVENGGQDVIRASLTNAIALTGDLDAVKRKYVS